jgi:hypothetical protein
MAKFTRNFTSGKMNKVVDERLVPNGEYIDAMNVRMGSTEQSEIGVIENTKGNISLTTLTYTDGTPLSTNARCIGAIEDSARETIYWFVHDPNFSASPVTGKLDLIVSYNVYTNILTYHVVSTDDGTGLKTTLNFNPNYLITGVNLIEDLLFFTDDYNQPRFINIKRGYPSPVSYVDDPLLAESILVIKKPPVEAPFVEPIQSVSQSNYMDTRFICFAYRYRYIDGEYSATSQWSDISFTPGAFNFSPDSYLNQGMENTCNSAKVTYNSGGPLVVGIDLLFKQADNNIIKIIEKLDKSDLGLADNTNYDYYFTNSKIFTILPEAELLRLYDNVPLVAKAQTIMGNRLMYGNYNEGYDLVDFNGSPVKFEYYTDLISKQIGVVSLPNTLTSSDYYIDGFKTVPNSVISIDFSGVSLVEGSSIIINITFEHESFSGTLPYPSIVTQNIQITFTLILQSDYPNPYALATSSEFIDVVGTALNIKPVYSPVPGADTSCDGFKLTDRQNCLIPNTLGSLTKYESGISAVGQPIAILANPLSSSIGLQLVAMKFVDNLVTPTQNVYEYYKIISATTSFQEIATPKSLHSNRGYEIGIVYMDEFNRATTALVSPNNTEYVPCGYSYKQNSIQVIIPSTQIAPVWAKRYKFVCKADLEGYETVYSNLLFTDPNTVDTYFLLEGENTRKVEVGDTLIVKADTSGILNNCVYTTVLEKESKQAGFLGFTYAPQGVYMKISANNFSTNLPANAIIAYGNISQQVSPLVYPVSLPNVGPPYVDYDIPAGTKIVFDIKISREGIDNTVGPDCPKRKYSLQQTYTASANYLNFFDWFTGDGIASTFPNGTYDLDPGEPNWSFYFSQAYSGGQPSGSSIPFSTMSAGACTSIYFYFERDISNNKLSFNLVGGCTCYGWVGGVNGTNTQANNNISVNITVYRSNALLVFETQPTETLPDVFYENHLSFEIDANGNHMGNVQDQDIALGIPAIVDTGFFNCFTFGNGVESYKINDSIIGRTFNLGNRVTSVSSQDYKMANRFSDITYSGVYNPESNLNKLNEFNLGLLNYKYLEVSFGEIQILDGRETDVLVLQEDKISYVLAGKNLLSDAAAGGAITSVPEVLGTQIARTEKYGVSFNAESYVQWGYDRFFTDAKRGAVLQLRGNSHSNEELKVISEQGMRTWFRDLFNDSFNTQKLGGFDPYMNEYVLSSNDIKLPSLPECVECGLTQTFTLVQEGREKGELAYCVDVGPLIGNVVIEYTVISVEGSVNIGAEYNGNVDGSGGITSPISGQLELFKDVNYIEELDMFISYEGTVIVSITVKCPEPQPMNIIEIVVSSDYQSGQTIHTEYRYTNGFYTSPLQSSLVTLASGIVNPLVSRYNLVSGFAGSPGFAPPGSTMKIMTNKIFPDNFVFNPSMHKFRYLRSSTLYPNTPVDVQTVLNLSTIATPITGGPTVYESMFTVPSAGLGENLYLIWDLRSTANATLCYDPSSITDICCECNSCYTECISYLINNIGSTSATVVFDFGTCRGTEPYTVTIPFGGEGVTVCVKDGPYEVTEGMMSLTPVKCDCECESDCWQWTITATDGSAVVQYKGCFDDYYSLITVVQGTPVTICVKQETTPEVVAGVATLDVDMSCGCDL